MPPPKKGKKGEGFHSAAGLIRYFDAEEESALKISPYMVMGFCAALIAIVSIAAWVWPLAD